MEIYKEWQYRAEIDEREKRYKINFIRKNDDWYDEVRYDSHEVKAGIWRPQPHLHIKIKAHSLESEVALERIKKIIEDSIPILEGRLR